MRIVSFLAVLFSVLTVSAHASTAEQSPRFLVHLLDYLAKDYGGAVSHGKVVSESEYHEQLEFSRTALETNSGLEETKTAPEIEQKLKELNQLIAARADVEKVSRLARKIQVQVIEITHLEIAPARWPSLKHGKVLFSQNCVACHGAAGAGDGPAGLALNPRPPNFLDNHMREVSPFQAFNTIRLGVPGTAMQPFHGLSDKEVWDLAFYVLSLRHSQNAQPGNQTAVLSWDTDALKRVATSSDKKLEGSIPQEKEEKIQVIASLRNHSDDDDSGGSSLALARTQLDEALSDYQAGKKDLAKTRALKAYLEGIEPVEPRLRASDSAAVSLLEARMADVRAVIEAGKPLSDLRAAVTAAKAQIDQSEGLLRTKVMSPWLAFLAASAIIFREGFEAVLVVIALLGVVRAAGSRRAALWVHGGWISALGLGGVAWFFSGWLMEISGAQRETLEGVTALFAVAVLLVVGFWLHSQTEIGRWKAFIHGKVQRALEGKNLLGLASISFIAVFREAFETVLFLRAIWLDGGDEAKMAMTAGVFGTLAFVIALAWLILKYSAKLPIRRLFEASAIIMAALAVILTGKGLHSLQETGALSITSSSMPFHVDLVGLYPTWETLGSQLLALAFVLVLWNYGKKPSTALSHVASSATKS